MAVFLDVRAAYDHVRLDILKQDMASCSFPPQIIKVICELFSRREIFIDSTEMDASDRV